MNYPVNAVLFPDVLLLDVTGPIQTYVTANRLSGKPLYQVQLLALEIGDVATDTGLQLQAKERLSELAPSGDLLIPGGPGVDHIIDDSEFIRQLAKQAEGHNRVISICSGSLLTAETGLLDGKEATSHWVRSPLLTTRFPKVHWRLNEIYTIDGRFCCSAGVTAGIDLALALIEHDHSRDLALAVAREMVVFLRRSGGQTQYSRPLQAQHAAGSRISALCQAIGEDPEQDWTVTRMSECANMTERTLHRHFLREFGQSPSHYVMGIRLDLARACLDQGATNLEQVAYVAGFRNEQAMRRCFVQQLGVTPGAYRASFADHGN